MSSAEISEIQSRSEAWNVITKGYLGDAALFQVEIDGITLMVNSSGPASLFVVPHDRWHVYA